MRILIIRFSSLGDVILTTGILRALSDQNPDLRIDVLTFSAFADMFRKLPYVSEIYTVEKGIALGDYKAFLKTMPAYDYLFDLHGNTRSALARKLLTGRASVYKKSGLARRLYVMFRCCRSKLGKHVVLRYAESVFPVLGCRTPSLEELRPHLPNTYPAHPKKIVLHPFASKFTKTWPQFSELAETLVKEGYDVKVLGKGDFPDIAGVERVDTPMVADMFDYMANAALVVSTDSGPMHAAIALNIPTVGVFGSTTRELGFFPEFDRCWIVERENVLCRPCHVHGRDKCPKVHFDCMKKISVNSVMWAVKAALEDAP